MEAPDMGPMPRESSVGFVGGATARCVPAVKVTHAAMSAMAKATLADWRFMGSSVTAELWHEYHSIGATVSRGDAGSAERKTRPPRLRVKRFSPQQLIE